MVDYGLVSRNINQLADRIASYGERSRQHEQTMASLGLQEARLGFKQKEMAGEMALKKASAGREIRMSEPITGMQAINELKIPDEQKQSMLQMFPEQDMNRLVFPRGKWTDGLSKFIELKTTEGFHDKQLANQKLQIENQAAEMARNDAYRSEQARLDAAHRAAALGLDREKLEWEKTKPRGGMSVEGQKYFDKQAQEYLFGKWGLAEGPDGQLISREMTPQQALLMRDEFNRLGYNVEFNDYDNKDPRITVRSAYKMLPGTGEQPRQAPNIGIKEPGKASPVVSEINRYLSGTQNKQATLQVAPQEPSITQRGNKFFKVEGGREIEMSPEEVKQWQGGSNALKYLESLFGGSATNRGAITGTAPQPRYRGF